MSFVSNVRNTPIHNTLKESIPKVETNMSFASDVRNTPIQNTLKESGAKVETTMSFVQKMENDFSIIMFLRKSKRPEPGNSEMEGTSNWDNL